MPLCASLLRLRTPLKISTPNRPQVAFYESGPRLYSALGAIYEHRQARRREKKADRHHDRALVRGAFAQLHTHRVVLPRRSFHATTAAVAAMDVKRVEAGWRVLCAHRLGALRRRYFEAETAWHMQGLRQRQALGRWMRHFKRRKAVARCAELVADRHREVRSETSVHSGVD